MLSPESSRPPYKEVEKKTYTAEFDSVNYVALREKKPYVSLEEYAREKSLLDTGTIINQKTWLGERFNAGLSTRRDRVLNGRLYAATSDELLQTIYERGRDYLYPNSSPGDRLREAAEVVGFKKIEPILVDQETPVGTMLLSISPKGGKDSQYTHNFYDVFTLREENGERYVESSRFSSALNYGEYMQRSSLLQPGYMADYEGEDQPLDVYFLSNPIQVSPDTGIRSPDQLHALLHKEHRTLSQDAMEYVFEGCDALFLSYVALLEKAPEDAKGRNELLNTIANKADTLVADYERKQAVRGDGYHTIYERKKKSSVEEDIATYAALPVRRVMTGCGVSGGFDVPDSASIGGSLAGGPSAIFSVYDVGMQNDKHGSRTFKCTYGHLNIREYNTLRPTCQAMHCDAVVAC